MTFNGIDHFAKAFDRGLPLALALVFLTGDDESSLAAPIEAEPSRALLPEKSRVAGAVRHHARPGAP